MKNNKLFVSFIFISISFFISATSLAQEWKWAVNGTGTNHLTEFLTTDSHNNSYFAVYYKDSLTFGGQSYFHQQWPYDYNCLLLKLDRQGNLLNQIDLYSPPGLMASLRPLTMSSDTMGNVYLAGSFVVRLFIGDTVINHLPLPYYEGPEAYLIKFNSDFDISWAKVIGCEHYMYFQSMAIHNNEICYSVNPHSWSSPDPITLYCFGQDTLYFANNQEYSVYFHLNLEGQILSHNVIYGNSVWVEREIIAENNDKYLIGITTDTIFEFDKPIYIPEAVNQWEQFVLHYDSNDSLIETTSVKTSNNSYVNIVAANSKNELFFYTTYVNGLTIGDSTISSIYVNSTLMGKLDAQRNPLWFDDLVGLETPSDLYMTQLHDTLYAAFDFNFYMILSDTTLLNSSLLYENYILKYAPDGTRINYFKTNTTGDSHTTGIALDNCENIFLSGTFKGTAYYGNDSIVSYYPSGSNADFFIAYLSNSNKVMDLGTDTIVCGQYVIRGPEGFEHYSWNNGLGNQKDLLVTQSGKYKLSAWTDKCCFMEDSVDITIMPIPFIDLGNDTTLKQSQLLQLSVASGYDEYKWSTGAESNSIILDGSKLTVGFHTIWCKATNNICVMADSLKLEVIDDYGISEQKNAEIGIIPNPFVDKFAISCETRISDVEVFDCSGNILSAFHTKDIVQPIIITLPSVVNRLLILKIKTDDATYYRKVLQLQ